jgi:DNA-binding NtrC family response regulator
MASGKILIVDDEQNALRVLSAILTREGYAVREAMSVDRALGIIQEEPIDAVITDVRMPVRDGFQLFHHIGRHNPDMPVMFLTAHGNLESAVEAMSGGAFYYFIKPPDYAKLKEVLADAVARHIRQRELENRRLEHGVRAPGFRILGASAPILRIRKTIDAIKDSGTSVLIQGETGTGKEVVAGNLHYRSSRSDKPFIPVNCAAIPRDLIESELFGYEKGAFTGASGSRAGRFEEAKDGTVFLDEIGEMELSLQSKLLRVLQERTIERLGSNRKIRVEFRLICSTNRNLKREVEEGRFRQDLYYRINVVQIDVPPLRARIADIPALAAEFIDEFCAREKKVVTLSSEALDHFMSFSWPGNVRQLKNVVEYAVVFARGRQITLRDLPEEFRSHRRDDKLVAPIRPLKALELEAIGEALKECHGNKSKAARTLGISRKALYSRLRKNASTAPSEIVKPGSHNIHN